MSGRFHKPVAANGWRPHFFAPQTNFNAKKINVMDTSQKRERILMPWVSKYLLIACFLGVGASSSLAQSGIEGKWKDNKNGGTILIYEEDGKYFGQLIGADNPEENSKIQVQNKKIVLLKDFKKESDTNFCCGTIYQPRHKRTISATLELEDENALRVNGKYGVFSGSQVWTRL
jgi:uncharacterized protein (DUF2147 family)